MFRIQKLMLLEYRGIYEPVIVENPFTQVSQCGEGLRQYHIGLTRSKIIFGCDDFDTTDLENFLYKGLDPEIETFQLLFWNYWRERVATIRLLHPDLFHISCATPYSSTDVLGEEETSYAQVHASSNYSQLSWRNYSTRCSLMSQ